MNFHELNFQAKPIPYFIGRDTELKWLDENAFRRGRYVTLITGNAGVGKTAIVQQWLASRQQSDVITLWFDVLESGFDQGLENLLSTLKGKILYPYEVVRVVLDHTEIWNEQMMLSVIDRITNFKVVESVFVIRQTSIKLPHTRELKVNPLNINTSSGLLRKLLKGKFNEHKFTQAAAASNGNPLALYLIAKLMQGDKLPPAISPNSQTLYDLSTQLTELRPKIIPVVKPIIVSANNRLVDALKKQPGDLHRLSSREFELLLADLLRDMGFDVEVTQATRDGGMDILVYTNSPVGRFLCLVEAKHYREDRKIGVELVRTLYGTLCDAQANSAMLVTSSSFTSGARAFQQKHEYQLKLREYADIVDWIIKFGSKK